MPDKTCTTCKNTLPLEMFYRQKKGLYGREARCKPCRSKQQRESPNKAEKLKRDSQRRREKMATDPEYRERQLSRARETMLKHSRESEHYREARRIRNREKKKKLYSENPEYRAAFKARMKEHVRSNPHKHKARIAVTTALQSGKLVRQPCEKCGNIKSQAHHDDYSMPLDVRWLCARHHAMHHNPRLNAPSR